MLKVFVDDLLIDELILTESIGRKGDINDLYDTDPFSQKKTRGRLGKNNWYYRTNFPMVDKLFMYEICEPSPGKKIRIEVSNNNTNYTNGFMTKYSYIVFDMVFLMPKKYFDDINLLLEDHPEIKSVNHASSGVRSKSDVDFWLWPWSRFEYNAQRDAWDNGLSDVKKGGSWDYSLDLSYQNGMTVISPKGFTTQLFEECFCAMEGTFLSYYVMGDLLNRYNEDIRDTHK
jgi:hypothetical protein